MKQRILVVLFILLSVQVYSQRSISLVYFDNTKTYLAGGSISVHFKPVGVYPFDINVPARTANFRLQLVRASDSSIVNNNIGSERGFFVPLLNGTIPNGVPNGNYKIKIISDSSGVELSNAFTNTFSIQNATLITRPEIQNPSENLQINCYPNNNYFGFVNKSNSGTPDVTSSIFFELKNYDNSFNYRVVFIDHSNNTTTNLSVTPNGPGIAVFEIPPGRPLNYYTIEIQKTKSGTTSSYSFIFLFNTGNTSLGNTSNETVCVGTSVNFSIDLQVISKNYPGSYYTIDFGDGSPLRVFTHEAILNNSNFSYTYSLTTCQAPINLNSNGKFKIEKLLYNMGFSNCSSYSKNGNGTIKYVNTSIAPTADFTAPTPICINSPQTFTNTSTQGFYGTGTTCLRKATYRWSTSRPSASGTFVPVSASFVDISGNLNIPANFFNEIGKWQIRLTAQNDSGCNTLSTQIKEICVEPQPVANFKFLDNGVQKDSIVSCSPKAFGIVNYTPTTTCGPTTYSWTVSNEATPLIPISAGGGYIYNF